MKKLERNKSKSFLVDIYKNCPKRTLLIADGSLQPWKLNEPFPCLGTHEILIKKIRSPETLKAFISFLTGYYSNSDETFYFLQQEVMSGTAPIDLELNITDMLELIRFFPETHNLDSILIDSHMTWILKFHHEGFGYFSGNQKLVDLIKSSDLSNFVDKPVWEKCD